MKLIPANKLTGLRLVTLVTSFGLLLGHTTSAFGQAKPKTDRAPRYVVYNLTPEWNYNPNGWSMMFSQPWAIDPDGTIHGVAHFISASNAFNQQDLGTVWAAGQTAGAYEANNIVGDSRWAPWSYRVYDPLLESYHDFPFYVWSNDLAGTSQVWGSNGKGVSVGCTYTSDNLSPTDPNFLNQTPEKFSGYGSYAVMWGRNFGGPIDLRRQICGVADSNGVTYPIDDDNYFLYMQVASAVDDKGYIVGWGLTTSDLGPTDGTPHGLLLVPDDCGCDSGTCTAGDTDPQISSLDLRISAGITNFVGTSFRGEFRLKADLPSPILATPAGLSFMPKPGFQVSRSPSVGIVLVSSAYITAQVIVRNAYKYDIQFSNNGNPNPYKTITIENPDASTTIYNRIRVTETQGSQVTIHDYSFDTPSNTWSLTSGNGARKESVSNVVNVAQSTRTETRIVTDSSNLVVSKKITVYKTFAWGEETIQEIVDPDGAALTTTWTFETDFSKPAYRQTTQKIDPTGHWERYEYDANARLTKVVAQFLDAAVGAAESTSRVTTHAYSTANPTETVIEYLLGQEVSRSYVANFGIEHWHIQCAVPGATWDAPTNLITKQKLDGQFRVRYETRPDGTATVGGYSTDGNGQTTSRVATGRPNSNLSAIIDGTLTTTTTDANGQVLLATTQDVASGLVLTSAVSSQFDAFGRAQRIDYNDGTFELTSYGCCGPDSKSDRAGIVTNYTYDVFKRVATETRAGITMIYVYDVMDRRTSTVRQGSDNSQIVMETLTYDLAGRMTSRKDAMGKITTFSELIDGSGHTIRTTTYPDSLGTRVETYAQDGSQLSVGGSAAHPLAYEYGVDINGKFSKEIRVGDGGTTTEWTKSYVDFAGRLYKAVTASGAVTQKSFNVLGQLTKSVDPDGVTTLLAYNTKGEQETVAVDMDQNGVIDFAGIDRITRVDRLVTSAFGTTVQRTITRVWPSNGSDSPTISSISDHAPSGRQIWQSDYGMTSHAFSTCDGTGTCTATAISPKGVRIVRVNTNGRLISETHFDSSGAQLSQVTYHYDPHGRVDRQTDARDGDAAFTYFNNDLLQSVSHAGQTTSYLYDALGKVTQETLPDAGIVVSHYFLTGELQDTSGARTYWQAFTYDSQGRLKTLTTNGAAGNAVTTWNYLPTTGLMTSKLYADGRGPSYTQTPAGRTWTRTWGRGITSTYSYNAAGELQSIVYSDTTPAVNYSYDRLGRINTATGGGGISRTLTYNAAGELTSDAYTSGSLAGWSTTAGYDTSLRLGTVNVMNGSSALVSQSYSYDESSRLKTAIQGAASATYSYIPNSSYDLINNIAYKNSGITMLVGQRDYDNLGRLKSISHTQGSQTASTFVYSYNPANQRTGATLAGGSTWTWSYDALGQVTSAQRKFADGTLVGGQQFGYTFDGIGNRTGTTVNGRAAIYTPNALNEYSQRTVPGALDITGNAAPEATVTVNGLAATRQNGGYFWKTLSVDNTSTAVNPAVSVQGVLNNSSLSGQDAIGMQSGLLLLQQTPEVLSYDFDGNVISDGRWLYSWDAENRLISIQAQSTLPATARLRIELLYDDMSRRIEKRLYTWTGSSYILTSTRRFLYIGWNLMAELNESNSLLYSILWGTDVSGGLLGPGGVGGVVAVTDHTVAPPQSHFSAADGSGNVIALISAADGSTTAQYEYGAFGENIRATGPMSALNPLRWSSKPQDESGMLYFGYRYYRSDLGCWLSRDPMNEEGGRNLYGYVNNMPTIGIDFLGLATSAGKNIVFKNTIVDTTFHIGPLPINLGDFTYEFRSGVYAFVNSSGKCSLELDPNAGVEQSNLYPYPNFMHETLSQDLTIPIAGYNKSIVGQYGTIEGKLGASGRYMLTVSAISTPRSDVGDQGIVITESKSAPRPGACKTFDVMLVVGTKLTASLDGEVSWGGEIVGKAGPFTYTYRIKSLAGQRGGNLLNGSVADTIISSVTRQVCVDCKRAKIVSVR